VVLSKRTDVLKEKIKNSANLKDKVEIEKIFLKSVDK